MTHALSRLWQRISRRPAPTITTTLVIDTAPFSEQMTRLAESWQIMHRGVANNPVHIAGLESRYFVRAGLDPTYAAPRALDLLVQQILLGVGDDLRWVNDENRSLIAAAALSGWVGSYAGGSTVRVLAWHRRIGSTHITVGRAS